MKKITKIGLIVTKIAEIFHWVATALMFVATICAFAAPSWVGRFVELDAKECCGTNLSTYGFEIHVAFENEKVDSTAFLLFGIGAILILIMMSFIFGNLYQLIKNSKNSTPFQTRNIRALRRVGILAIAVPIVGLIMNVISHIVLGAEQAETSNNFSGLIIGIVVLCITEFFIHGITLENDVDGLL